MKKYKKMNYKEYIRSLKDEDIFIYFKPFLLELCSKKLEDAFICDFLMYNHPSNAWHSEKNIITASHSVVKNKQNPFSILDYSLWSSCDYGDVWRQLFIKNGGKYRNSWGITYEHN